MFGKRGERMTWIALVGPEVEENLSLRYVSSSLMTAGYRTEILPFNIDQDFPRVARDILGADEPPVLVGLSLAFQWRAHDFLALAMALRQGGYEGHITCGGHFATFCWRELLTEYAELDTVCRFEAEYTIVDLVQTLIDGRPYEQVAGLGLRRDGKPALTPPRALPDLKTLPFPDRRGSPALCFGHKVAPLVSSRGCYANCSFCCIAAWQEKGLPGKRYRLRTVEDVADEMVEDQRRRGTDIFIFQDDNFFVPSAKRNLARINDLADALEARGIGKFATVVKARPPDVREDVFEALVNRLNCIRAYVGIETDTDTGNATLTRLVTPAENREAMRIVRKLGLYVCFNLLIFDPDTTPDHLEQNLKFMELFADYPFGIARVELYAGTPLLTRMQAEGRCTGNWIDRNYTLGTPEMERIFQSSFYCLRSRHHGDSPSMIEVMLLRFDIEACAYFHPEVFQESWRDEAIALTRVLTGNTVSTLRSINERIAGGAPAKGDRAFANALRETCFERNAEISDGAAELAARIGETTGNAASLTEVRRLYRMTPDAQVAK